MSNYGYAYGAAADYAAAPFDNLPLPNDAHLDLDLDLDFDLDRNNSHSHNHFESSDDENAVDLEYLEYGYHPEHVDADVDAHYNGGLGDVGTDIDDDDDDVGDQDIDVVPPESINNDDDDDDNSQPSSQSSPVGLWYDGSSDPAHRDSESPARVLEGQDEHDVEDEDATAQHHCSESEEDLDHLQQPDLNIPDSPPHLESDDERSVASIDDHQSTSPRTASLFPNRAGDGGSLRSPAVSLQDDHIEFGSSSPIAVLDDSDIDIDTPSAPGTASQSQQSAESAPSSSVTASASASSPSPSQGSRLGPRTPHHRQPIRRVSDHSDLDTDFNNNPRVSPRLSSLTPVIHPNRRLPRQSPDFQRHQNLLYAPSDPSDSSADELIAPQPQRRLGIERTRRPIFANSEPLQSSDEDHNNNGNSNSYGSGIREPFPGVFEDSDDEPIIQDHFRGDSGQARHIERLQSSEQGSDLGEVDRRRSNILSQIGVEERDNLSESDFEQDLVLNNPPQGGGSQAGGPAQGHHYLDGVAEDEEGDIVLQDRQEVQQRRVGNIQVLELSEDEDEEEEIGLVARQQQRRRDLAARRQQQQEAAAAERRRRAARNPFLDSDLEQSDADMDGDDELVEVVFDRQLNGPFAPPLQRQPRHQQRQRNHRQDNRANAVDFIDLTEEPDSPVLNQRLPNNIRGAFQNHNIDQQQRPRRPRRMPQNGRPPSLARSDGSILGQRARPAVIDLTNDEDLEAAADDSPDEDDDLFVAQDFDDFEHIPPDLRLPVPVPAPLRDRRRSVEVIGSAARNFNGRLGDLGRRYFPGLLAALPGLPRGIANEIAIIGRDHALAMNPNPLADNPPDFNYQANGFGGRPPPPKPEFDAPPPARPGFTRNTGVDPETGEELVIVCASCDNELKYEDDEDDGPRPAKRPRNKKDREEHHFWAVKACGHVYCKSCYDNRKRTKGKEYETLDMGFRVEQTAAAKLPKVFCAVDDCASDVTQNNSWVGIFM